MTATIAVVNPLGGALAHYTGALTEVLRTTHDDVQRFDVDEPSISGRTRARWVCGHVRALVAARRAAGISGTVVVTWPVLGWLDLVLFRLAGLQGTRTALVVHDPEPLVRAVGYDRVSLRVARVLGKTTTVVVHGTEAHTVVESQGFGSRCVLLPHPVQPHGRVVGSTAVGARPVLRVLGSHKADRDVDLLRMLAERLGGAVALEIHGRGWPPVPGWTTVDGFVSESRLDELIRSAAVVLVPYRRVFQSGIAVRAVELGTPFVGPRVSAHADLYADDLDLLVPVELALEERVDRWVHAIERAIQLTDAQRGSVTANAVARCASAWARLSAEVQR